jgi:SET domain-containing protein
VASFFLLEYLLKKTLSDTSDYKVPAITLNDKDSVGNMNDYVFSFNLEDNLVGFGYCSMYNHQDDPNANWEVINKDKIEIKVVKPIQKGEEIFISYGEGYFNYRKHIVQNNVN